MWGHEVSLEKHYKGFHLYGRADSLDNYTDHWRAVADVYVDMPDNSLQPVDTLSDLPFTFDDEHLAAWCSLFLGELTVDHFALPREYYLLPMSMPWAVDIVRRGAEEFMQREIQRPKLFEALDYLDKRLEDRAWLVRRYRYRLRGDCRNVREQRQKQERLRVAARGIQLACAELIVAEMNDLAARYRENKPKIEKLQRMLQIVRRPVPR